MDITCPSQINLNNSKTIKKLYYELLVKHLFSVLLILARSINFCNLKHQTDPYFPMITFSEKSIPAPFQTVDSILTVQIRDRNTMPGIITELKGKYLQTTIILANSIEYLQYILYCARLSRVPFYDDKPP